MHPHVPLANLGSPGLPLTSYDQLGPRVPPNLPWPPEPRARHTTPPRRGLLRRVARPLRLAPGRS